MSSFHRHQLRGYSNNHVIIEFEQLNYSQLHAAIIANVQSTKILKFIRFNSDIIINTFTIRIIYSTVPYWISTCQIISTESILTTTTWKLHTRTFLSFNTKETFVYSSKNHPHHISYDLSSHYPIINRIIE